MTAIGALRLLVIPIAAAADPGGGLIALDAKQSSAVTQGTTLSGDWRKARSWTFRMGLFDPDFPASSFAMEPF